MRNFHSNTMNWCHRGTGNEPLTFLETIVKGFALTVAALVTYCILAQFFHHDQMPNPQVRVETQSEVQTPRDMPRTTADAWRERWLNAWSNQYPGFTNREWEQVEKAAERATQGNSDTYCEFLEIARQHPLHAEVAKQQADDIGRVAQQRADAVRAEARADADRHADQLEHDPVRAAISQSLTNRRMNSDF